MSIAALCALVWVPGVYAQLFEEPRVQPDSTIWLTYLIHAEDGVLIDSHAEFGQEALEFVVGRNRLLPGLERALIGMSAGQEKIMLLPEDAYGFRDPAAVRVISRAELPDRPYRRGDYVLGVDDQQLIRRGRVIISEADTITVDFNPPAAGAVVTVRFEVLRLDNDRVGVREESFL